jgi:hypothetical protein
MHVNKTGHRKVGLEITGEKFNKYVRTIVNSYIHKEIKGRLNTEPMKPHQAVIA